MPDVREKLVELLGNLFCGDYGINGCDSCKYNTEAMCSAYACADHLIRGGVTIQRWIPVTERLPEKQAQYICRYAFGEEESYPYYQILWYFAVDKNPHFQNEGGFGLRVTHWMPLPEAPKGQ